MDIPQYITIDLGSFRAAGSTALLFRMRLSDKHKIDRAARLIGVQTAMFARMALIQSAEQVLAASELEAAAMGAPRKPKTKIDPDAIPGKRVTLE